MIKKIFFSGKAVFKLGNFTNNYAKLTPFKRTYSFCSDSMATTLRFPRLQELNESTVKRISEEKVKNNILMDYLKKMGSQVGELKPQEDLNLLLLYGKQLIMLCMGNDASRGDYYMVEFYKIIIQSIEKALENENTDEAKGVLQGKYFMSLTTLANLYYHQGYLDHCFECTKKLLDLYNGRKTEKNKHMTFIPDNVFYMIGDGENDTSTENLSSEIEFFYCDKASVLFQQLQKYPEAQVFSDKALEITLGIQNKPGSFYFNAFNQNISLILLSGNNEQVIARYQNLIDKFDYNKIKDQKTLLDKYSLRVIQAMQISMNFFKDKFNLFWSHYKKFKTETEYKQSREEILRIHYTYIHNTNPTFFQDKNNQEKVDSFIQKYDDLFLQKFKDIFFNPLKQKQQPLYDYCLYLQHTESQYKKGLIQTLTHLKQLKESNNPSAITPEFEEMFYKNIKVYIQLDYFIEQFSKEILSLPEIESEPLQILKQINFMSPEKQEKINKLILKYNRKIE